MDNLKDSPHLMVITVGAAMLREKGVCGEGSVFQGSQPLLHISIFWRA